ncbi:MAG: hypothetical protein ACI39F_08850 [Acutalibacteraceae bacterium]
MADYKYNVVMKTLLGQKKGTIELFSVNGKLTGFLDILGKRNAFEGTISKDGKCKLSGNIITLVQSIPYIATGYADKNKIELTLKCKKYVFNILGSS